MKISDRWFLKSIVGKMMMGLVLAAMVGSTDVAPAFAKDDHKQMGKHDNGRSEHRGRGYERNRYEQRRVYRAPVYRERVYIPPPVIYEPPPPPGISIFLPPFFLRL